MINPSNFSVELRAAKERIKQHIESTLQEVLKKELEQIMGRVKILVTSDMDGTFSWYIESDKK